MGRACLIQSREELQGKFQRRVRALAVAHAMAEQLEERLKREIEVTRPPPDKGKAEGVAEQERRPSFTNADLVNTIAELRNMIASLEKAASRMKALADGMREVLKGEGEGKIYRRLW